MESNKIKILVRNEKISQFEKDIGNEQKNQIEQGKANETKNQVEVSNKDNEIEKTGYLETLKILIYSFFKEKEILLIKGKETIKKQDLAKITLFLNKKYSELDNDEKHLFNLDIKSILDVFKEFPIDKYKQEGVCNITNAIIFKYYINF